MRLLYTYCALVFGLAAAQVPERYGAVPIDPNGLTPRYFLDKSLPVEKRAGTSCGDDKHSCLDVGFGDGCCDNDSYCYVNGSGALKCCPIGSNCVDDSPCNSTAYFCTRTVTASGTPTAREGCCGRRCPETSLFLCASSLGGGCCSYGANCRVNGNCAAPKTASASDTLTPVTEGCTTSQHKCADGTGCCDDSQYCTQVSGTGYCAAGKPSESVTIIPNPDNGGLSNGAKAGIGVGAVVGTSILVGGLTWLCISKRRQRTLSRQSGIDDSGTGGDNAPVDVMTEVSATDGSRARQGLTHDYFGPDAVAGPYTETTAPFDTSPGQSRAVPTQPDGPGDITTAVEIDSTARENTRDGFLSPQTNSSIQATPQSETVEGRFELYGSDEREPLSIVPTPQESPIIKDFRRAE